jgi:hypothetical protein
MPAVCQFLRGPFPEKSGRGKGREGNVDKKIVYLMLY